MSLGVKRLNSYSLGLPFLSSWRFGSLVLVPHFHSTEMSHKGHNFSSCLISATPLYQRTVRLQHKIRVLQIKRIIVLINNSVGSYIHQKVEFYFMIMATE